MLSSSLGTESTVYWLFLHVKVSVLMPLNTTVECTKKLTNYVHHCDKRFSTRRDNPKMSEFFCKFVCFSGSALVDYTFSRSTVVDMFVL